MAGGPGSYVFGQEEKKELLEVMESGHLSRYGQESDPLFKRKVITFEAEFAQYSGVPYCVATSSGTGALLCCLAALGIGPGDEVIVPGYTFIASISAIILSGAIPVLAEIDESLTLDPTRIEEKISPRTKAIMPVHMLGNPCDMDAIMQIATARQLLVIEDCCQAAGAEYRGKKVGAFGHISAFSLNTYKTISAGDGGMVISQDQTLYKRAFGFHDQGHNPHRYGVEIGKRSIVGMNFRMNELTGAVALAQLRKIDQIIAVLRKNKTLIKEVLQDVPGISFRKINDMTGECATLLTLLFATKEAADAVGAALGAKTLAHSGWHVYNNMEQILSQDRACYAHMLPQTDQILERAINISIGVVDQGLGAGYGINILSDETEIMKVASDLKNILMRYL
jgi:dTDP-4-amino-4,6-dideoxygalactose transaminase